MPSTKGLARKKVKERGTPISRKRKSAAGVAVAEREVRLPLAKQFKLSGGGNVRMLRSMEGKREEEREDSEADVGVVSDSNVPLDSVAADVDEVRGSADSSRTVLSSPRLQREREGVKRNSQSVRRVLRDSVATPSAVMADAGMMEGEEESVRASIPVTQNQRERKRVVRDAWGEGLAKLAELRRLGSGRARLTQALKELEMLAGEEADSEEEVVATEVVNPVTPMRLAAAPGAKAAYCKQYGDRFASVCQTSLTDSMTAPDMAAWLVAAKHAVRYAESCATLPAGISAIDSYTLVSKRIVGRVCKYAISVSEAGRHRDTAEYLDTLVQGLIEKNCRNVTLRVDAIARLAACKQGEREPLLEYLDRYRTVVELVLASAYGRWGEAERERWSEDVMLELQQGLLHPSLAQRLGRAKLWEEKSEDFESYWQYLCHYLIDHERRGYGAASLRTLAAPEGVPVSLGVADAHPAPAPRAPIVHESRVHQIAQGTVATVAPRRSMSEIECFRCAQRGHIMANCPMSRERTSPRGNKQTCFGCGKPGHILRDCRSARRGQGRNVDQGGRKKYQREEPRVATRSSTPTTNPAGTNADARVNAVQGAGCGMATVDGILSSLYSASADGAALASGARIFMIQGSAAGGGGSGGGGGKRPRSTKGTPKGSSTTPRRKIKKVRGAVVPPAAAEAEKVETKPKVAATEVAKPASPRASAAAPAVSPAKKQTYAAAVATSVAVPARARAPAAAPSSPSQGKTVARLSGPRHRAVAVASWTNPEEAGVGWMDQLGERLFEQVRSVSALLSAALLVLGRVRGCGHNSIEGWWTAAIERLKFVTGKPAGPFVTAQQREGLLEDGERGLADMLGCPLEGYGNTLRGVGAVIQGRTVIEQPRDELVEMLTPRGSLSTKDEHMLVCMCLRAIELYWLLSARAVVLRHLIRDCIGMERKLPGQVRVESRAALYRILASASPAAHLAGFAKALPAVLSRLTPNDAVSNTLLRVEAWSGKTMFSRSPSVFGFSEVEAASHERLFVVKDKPERMGCPKGLAGLTVVLSGSDVDNSPLTREDVGRRDRAIKAYSDASRLVLASLPASVAVGSPYSSSGAPAPTAVEVVPPPIEIEKTEEGAPSPPSKATAVVEETPSGEGLLTAESADALVKQASAVMMEAVKQVEQCVSRGTARGRGVELRMSLSDMWVILLEALGLYGTMVAERAKAVEEHGKTRVSRTSPTGAVRFGAGLAVRAHKRRQVTLWLEACDALSDAIAAAIGELRKVYSGPIEVGSAEILDFAGSEEVGKEVEAMWVELLARVGGGAPKSALEVMVLSTPRRVSEEIQAVPITPPVDAPALEKVPAGSDPMPKEKEAEQSMDPIEVGEVLAPTTPRPMSLRTPVDPPVVVTTGTTPSRYEERGIGEIGDERVSSACRRHCRLGCCVSPFAGGDCYSCCVPGLITLGSRMGSGRTLGERTAKWHMLVGADALVDGSTCGDDSDNGALVVQGGGSRAQGRVRRTQRSRGPGVSCVCGEGSVASVLSTHAFALCCGASKEVILNIRTLRWGYDVLGALSWSECHKIILVFCVAPERVVVSIPRGGDYIDTVKQRIIKYSLLDTRQMAGCYCGDSWCRGTAVQPDERLDGDIHPLRGTNTTGAMALYKSKPTNCAERSGSHCALQNERERGPEGRQGRYTKTALLRVATSESEIRWGPVGGIGEVPGYLLRHGIAEGSRYVLRHGIDEGSRYVLRHGIAEEGVCVARHSILLDDERAATVGSVDCDDRSIMCCHDSYLSTVPEVETDGSEVGYRLASRDVGAGVDRVEYSAEVREAVSDTPWRDEAKPRAVANRARVAQMRVADRRVPAGQAETHPLLVALLRRGGLSVGVAGVAAGNPASPYVTVRVEEREDLQLRALLDSGATHSCISKKALENVAHAVGAEKVNRWPKAPTPMTVSMANGAQVRPCGAIVLRMGLLTLRHTVVWSDMAFLIFEGMSEDIILGMDWEERMGVTRLQPARMLGLSVTEQSRATYLNWGADTLSRRAMVRDIPAEVFNHLIPFAMGGEIAGSQRSLLPHAVECTETTCSSVSTLQMLGSKQQQPEGSCEGEKSQSRPTAGSRSPRAALRSVRHFAIPPRTEVGPIEVEVRCPTASQPL